MEALVLASHLVVVLDNETRLGSHDQVESNPSRLSFRNPLHKSPSVIRTRTDSGRVGG